MHRNLVKGVDLAAHSIRCTSKRRISRLQEEGTAWRITFTARAISSLIESDQNGVLDRYIQERVLLVEERIAAPPLPSSEAHI
mmetsp:Transcript_30368/g.48732  ORF Transcript_30368/g.48732 Transcript_30368/m.48732 type:complete len:83 (+) Transcript_30368:405-653(+)